jgi:pimeloyl-ACP methyl ester carboxylesterase
MKTYVFVHGMWACPQDWDDVIAAIGDRAQCVAVDLPSMRSGAAALADDAACIRELIADEDDIVLVAHSYGGMVITEAGDAPNVRHLVYIAAALPEKEQSLFDIASASADPMAAGDIEFRDDGTTVIAGFPDGDLYAGYSPAVRAGMRTRPRRPGTVAAAFAPCTATAWRSVPHTYVVAQRDTTFVAVEQRRMAAHALRTFEIDAAHFVINEAPAEVAEIVLGV